MQAIALKFLHILPPELAHRITLFLLQLGLGVGRPANGTPISFFGKTLKGRVGLSGGADKNAQALAGWRKMGFSFVELGTVTLEPRKGNSGTRVWRMKDKRSLINWMGLPNLGADAIVKNLTAFRMHDCDAPFCIGVSVASPTGSTSELCDIASKFCEYTDFFTLNASCPNVAEHAVEHALLPIIQQLKATIAGAGGKPVLVKLAPTNDEEILRSTARNLVAAGAAGFIACNTLPSSSVLIADESLLPEIWPSREGRVVGGYSGPALLPISTWMVRVLRSEIGKNKVIIGVGGIASENDAKAMIEAGADLIQLYTALTYQGPALIERINDTLN
jgi:dihydroorotate dehydrogenase